MFKFFRKIRQNLLSEGKTGKYLKYAAGEIVLVVIGILIALQLNTLNQNRIDNNREIKYLLNLKAELQANINLNARIVTNRMEGKLEGLKLAKDYIEKDLPVIDTLTFLNKISYGGIFSGGGTIASRSYYDELINTGNLQLIKQDTIKKALARYYGRLDIYAERSHVSKSRFSSFTAELRPFDPANPNFISKYDQAKMIKAFKTAEFEKIVNQELSYAYEMGNNVRKQKERADLIIKLINQELKGEL